MSSSLLCLFQSPYCFHQILIAIIIVFINIIFDVFVFIVIVFSDIAVIVSIILTTTVTTI